MRNFIQDGDSLTVTAPYAVSSGAGVQVGTALFGVATATAANAAEVVIKTAGVFDLAAKTTDTCSVGAKLYWDNTNKELTTTSSGNLACAIALVAKVNPDTTARVLLVMGL